MVDINGWNLNVEQLLQNWSRQIRINESQYRERGSYFKKWYYGFGLFFIVAQTGALTTLINAIVTIVNNSVNEDKCTEKTPTIMAILIFITIMEIFILIAQGIDKFFNFGSASEQYYDAAKEHDALGRLIDATLMLPRITRDHAREVLLSIREQFNHLIDNSPDLPPNEIVHRLDMCIYDNPEQARGHKISVIVKDNLSPPENATPVKLPQSPPNDTESESVECNSGDYNNTDEEHVGTVIRCKVGSKMKEHRVLADKENTGPGMAKYLEYQWNRLERHSEDA